MKKLFVLLFMAVLLVSLTACWPGEIGITTVFNANGSGTRTIVLDVMDDLLSTEPIGNPDDPEGVEGKGAVLNDKHIEGGVVAIQTWLEENAPDFITVEAMRTEGYHRYFTMTYDFSSFDDFLDKYEQLVDLSPNMSWSDFDDTEKPSMEVTGGFKKSMTFKESRAVLEASLDWAIDGIWTDIYDGADIVDYVTKADISVLAGYTVKIGDEELEELRYYDPEAEDGDTFTGKVIFVESDEFELAGSFTNTGLIIGLSVGVVAIAAGAVVFFMKRK